MRSNGADAIRREKAQFLQAGENLVDTFFYSLAVSFHHDLRMKGFFIGIGNPSKFLDFASQGFFVEPFHITSDQSLKRTLSVHLNKVANATAYLVAYGSVWRDSSGDHRCPIARQQLGDIADAANVGVTIFFAKAQAFAEIGAHLIAIEHLDSLAQGLESRGKRFCERGLPRS